MMTYLVSFVFEYFIFASSVKIEIQGSGTLMTPVVLYDVKLGFFSSWRKRNMCGYLFLFIYFFLYSNSQYKLAEVWSERSRCCTSQELLSVWATNYELSQYALCFLYNERCFIETKLLLQYKLLLVKSTRAYLLQRLSCLFFWVMSSIGRYCRTLYYITYNSYLQGEKKV